MRQYLKRYTPVLFTLLLIVLGAAMPWLTASIQDAQIGKMQDDLDLNTVSLTLLQNHGVEQSLCIASSKYANIPWSGGTALTEQQALQAAEDTLAEIYSFGLLQKKWMRSLDKAGAVVEPCLMVAEDGSSALVWDCRWGVEDTVSCVITVDDASGKTVQIYTSGLVETDNTASSQSMGGVTIYGASQTEAYWAVMEMWASFLEYYYGASLMTITELKYFSDSGMDFLLGFEFYTDDTVWTCSLPLEIYSDGVRFNFLASDAGLMAER